MSHVFSVEHTIQLRWAGATTTASPRYGDCQETQRNCFGEREKEGEERAWPENAAVRSGTLLNLVTVLIITQTARERALQAAKPVVEVDPDPDRLLQGTKASRAWELSDVALEERQMQREQQGAHSRPIAGAGYDLKFTGRATPAWMK